MAKGREAAHLVAMPASGRAISFLLLFLLAVLWGSSYLFIKIAVETIAPLTIVAARVALSALMPGR